MDVAFLCAGQGSQTVGMGGDLISACDECREVFDAADRALGYSLSQVIAAGPQEELNRTAITQPAILTLSVAHARHLIASGLRPAMLAGHSLGQYTALVIAGSLDFRDAVRLVAERGRLMQETVPEGEGAMAAIIGLERGQIYAACEKARPLGAVNVACHNAPEQTVISGARAAVTAAAEDCEERGGSSVPLPVSAPFHCDLLLPMAPAFTRLVEAVPMADPAIPVIDNVTALPLADAAAVRYCLVAQLTSPVLFEESLEYMAGAGIDHYVQCGPGRSLLSFAKRVVGGAKLSTFDAVAQAAASPSGY